jgi:nitroimidazol reductase NimA-like FMN-containing flavoprotein (pyridoxamine 5'-phosphate oxidase superfamily)
MLGKLDAEGIERVLLSQVIGRIGCHCEGLTYVVPVTYVYDGRRVIVHSADGMKLQMMRANPHVCFQIDEITAMTAWKSVIVWGSFNELTGTEAAQAMGFLVDRMKSTQMSQSGFHSHDDPSKMKAIVYEIIIDQKTGRFEKP